MTRMIITDLDQTLLRDDGTVSDHTCKVWQECRKAGIVTGIATARLEANALHIQEKLGADLLICSNGSKVIWQGRRLFCETLDAQTVGELVAALCGLPSQKEILLEGKEQVYINTHRFRTPHPLAKAVYTDFSQGFRQEACQIFAGIEKEEEADLVRGQFPGCRCLHYRDSTRYAFLAGQVSKEKAIKEAAERLSIPLNQVAAFGDDEGDKEMLALCGLGVAMGNALPEVKAAADAVTDTNEKDGVAGFIEREILKKRQISDK